MNTPMHTCCDLLIRNAQQHPDHPAVILDEESLSYAELHCRSTQIATLLCSLNVENPRIALLAENGLNYVIVYWGILLAGKISVELNPNLGQQALLAQLQQTKPALLLVDTNLTQTLRDLDVPSHENTPMLALHGGVASKPDHALSHRIRHILVGGSDHAPTHKLPRLHKQQLASIVHTSGTTGKVKGVCLQHGAYLWTVRAIAQSLALEPKATGEIFSGNLPLFYTYGKSILHLATYLAAPIVFMQQGLSPHSLLKMVKAKGVTHLPLVPYLGHLLLRSAAFSAEQLPTVRLITIAGGAVSKPTFSELCRRFPQRITPMYGMAEACTRIACMPVREAAQRYPCCGKPLTGVELAIVDAQKQPAACLSTGEVLVRGPNLMAGYYQDVASTNSTIQAGWLSTGDLGFVDADNYLTIVGRKKDTIKSMGESICASEIEEVIMTLPGVLDVAVKAVPDAMMGEAIGCFIVRDKNAALLANDIRQHCRAQLGAARVPKQIKFMPELPKTASGKTIKYLLK